MSVAKKLMILSLDLMLALPIASVAFLLLFSSIRGSQDYQLASAAFTNRDLNAFTVSQQIATTLDASALNHSMALLIASNISKEHGLTSSMTIPEDAMTCTPLLAVCRLVTISGSSYVLVVSHESAS